MRRDLLELRPSQRRWADLRIGRLCGGLLIAPIPAALLGLVIIVALDSALSTIGAMVAGAICAAAVTWALIVGWAYLLLIARRRGILSRVECLVLGIVAASSMPLAVDLLSHIADWLSSKDAALADDGIFVKGLLASDDVVIALILGLVFAPFGLLGGWIFWRVGVRPVVTTLPDVAPVFD